MVLCWYVGFFGNWLVMFVCRRLLLLFRKVCVFILIVSILLLVLLVLCCLCWLGFFLVGIL